MFAKILDEADAAWRRGPWGYGTRYALVISTGDHAVEVPFNSAKDLPNAVRRAGQLFDTMQKRSTDMGE